MIMSFALAFFSGFYSQHPDIALRRLSVVLGIASILVLIWRFT